MELSLLYSNLLHGTPLWFLSGVLSGLEGLVFRA